jgi:hypothetical protein
VELGTGFDPALADLYADDAVIHLTGGTLMVAPARCS